MIRAIAATKRSLVFVFIALVVAGLSANWQLANAAADFNQVERHAGKEIAAGTVGISSVPGHTATITRVSACLPPPYGGNPSGEVRI
jgi:hypothetical protein